MRIVAYLASLWASVNDSLKTEFGYHQHCVLKILLCQKGRILCQPSPPITKNNYLSDAEFSVLGSDFGLCKNDYSVASLIPSFSPLHSFIVNIWETGKSRVWRSPKALGSNLFCCCGTTVTLTSDRHTDKFFLAQMKFVEAQAGHRWPYFQACPQDPGGSSHSWVFL